MCVGLQANTEHSPRAERTAFACLVRKTDPRTLQSRLWEEKANYLTMCQSASLRWTCPCSNGSANSHSESHRSFTLVLFKIFATPIYMEIVFQMPPFFLLHSRKPWDYLEMYQLPSLKANLPITELLLQFPHAREMLGAYEVISSVHMGPTVKPQGHFLQGAGVMGETENMEETPWQEEVWESQRLGGDPAKSVALRGCQAKARQGFQQTVALILASK